MYVYNTLQDYKCMFQYEGDDYQYDFNDNREVCTYNKRKVTQNTVFPAAANQTNYHHVR